MKGIIYSLTDDLSHRQLIDLLVYLAKQNRLVANIKAWRKKQGLLND